MPTYRKNESDREIDQFVDSITEGQPRAPMGTGRMGGIKAGRGGVVAFRGGVMGGWKALAGTSQIGEEHVPDTTSDLLTEEGGFMLLEDGGKILITLTV